MPSKKVSDLKIKPKVLVDSIVVVAWVDSAFVKITQKDTSGYLVDFINRFSEENSLFVTYRLFPHFSQAIEAFMNQPNYCLFVPANHASLNIKRFQFSKPILERNLPLTSDLLTSLLTLNYSTYFSSMYRVKHLFFQGLQASAESVLKVPSCFAVNSSDSLQLKRLDAFITRVENRADIAFLKHFYFKIQLPLSMRRYRVPFAVNGQVSPFDASFKKNAKFFAIDWKLVAAIAFKESRFNPVAVGSGGAYGLMQFMPFVASKYKIDGKSTPDEQIRAGCRLVHNSYRAWNSIESEEQRIKFTLASYNAGQGHVLDAQRLAKKYGLNPQVWDDNVQLMVNNLSLAKYYKDPLVKSGPYHGHADQYANLVYQIYLSWKAI
ncbi:MAG: hypothetical protein RL432_36 [Bacteroidota bacterium]|jgi:membrane-bound lytic murein transglycosylase F